MDTLIDRIYKASERVAEKLTREITRLPITQPKALDDQSVRSSFDKMTTALRKRLAETTKADLELSIKMRGIEIPLWQGTLAWAKSWPELLVFAGICLSRAPLGVATLALKAIVNCSVINACHAGYKTSKPK